MTFSRCGRGSQPIIRDQHHSIAKNLDLCDERIADGGNQEKEVCKPLSSASFCKTKDSCLPSNILIPVSVLE